ncbi:hypothetical protein KFL_005100040 [Klebsormidium nitens]|uniref:Fibronectin type-III domain-containing protein n=1 Tax=Klebsormidium nitens TaxID=105231 RepID=A0A1Y1IEC9_KLENI|nr:hypothetical protein KFL_005100040 [Klebsormidium nitens]|eukprot:GAQ89314.1 hypothetical protein KFL_005100040 [Klebsormidium nitens]
MAKKGKGSAKADKAADGVSDADRDALKKDERIAQLMLELEEAKLGTAFADKRAEELMRARDDLRREIITVKQDCDDVLADMERELAARSAIASDLQKTVDDLTAKLEARDLRVQELEREREIARQQMAQAGAVVAEREKTLARIRELEAELEGREAKIRIYESNLNRLEGALRTAQQSADDLRLAMARSTHTVFVGALPWTLQHTRQKLTDSSVNVPTERDRSTLTKIGSKLYLFGGTTRGGSGTNELFAYGAELSLWERVRASGDAPCARGGHCAVALPRGRLLVFGGRRNPLLNDCVLFNVDSGIWTPLKTSGVPPPLVEKAAMVVVGNRVLLLGGDCGDVSENDPGIQVLQGLFELDLETFTWRICPATGIPPQRCGMTLTAAEDGQSVFAFGGYGEDGACRNDIHVLNVPGLEWSSPPMVMGTPPAPREGHAATMIGRYLLISGGHDRGHHYFDTFMFDTELLCWESLDSGSGLAGFSADSAGPARLSGSQAGLPGDPSGRPRKLSEAPGEGSPERRLRLTAFVDNKLLCWHPTDKTNSLILLDTVDIQIPEGAFVSRAVRNDEIAAEAHADPKEPRAVDVTWRVPPKHKKRAVAFKVLMGVKTSNVIREVYSGTEDHFHLSGLRSGADYYFRVKGEFQDGGCLWSNVAAFHLEPAKDRPVTSPSAHARELGRPTFFDGHRW